MDRKDLKDFRVMKLSVSKDFKDLLLQIHRDFKVFKVFRDPGVFKCRMEHKADKVLGDRQACVDLSVFKAFKDHKGVRVFRGFKAYKEIKDDKEHKDIKV